jgi:hypothetical protein
VFFFAKLFSLRLWSQRKKRTNDLSKPLWGKGNPPLVRFPSFRLRRKFTLRWRFGRIKEFRPLRRATADRGGSDELLKKLEQNFQQNKVQLTDKSKFEANIKMTETPSVSLSNFFNN